MKGRDMNRYSFSVVVGGLLLMAAPVSAAPLISTDVKVTSAVENVHYRRYRHRHYGYRYYPRYYGYRHYPRYYGYRHYPRYGYSGYYGPRAGFSIGPLGFYW
jgi:hypothetical protein